MAVTPNDQFTAGQVLTATECNQFPRGLMQSGNNQVTDAAITVDKSAVSLTFTAEANRSYRLIYTEPQLSATAITFFTIGLRQGATFATSTLIAQAAVGIPVIAIASQGFVQSIGTFTAGSTTIYAAIQINAGTGTATRSAFKKGLLTVEDIGTA
jgi:hypothetical protein